MSYYHCHIILTDQKRDKDYYLNNLEKEKLVETIVVPFVNGNQFIFDGYVINPNLVKRLKITETNESASFYAERHNEQMRRAGISDFATNRKSLPIEKGKDITIQMLDDAKKEFQTKISVSKTKVSKRKNNKVFVVHGHDMSSLHEICRILKDDFNLDPIVLSEQPIMGLDTIISKFERVASDCICAIVMLTPDDKVEKQLNNRARQNVIFELGYFLKMMRSPDDRKIIILKKGETEIPSDINGVLYCQFQSNVTEVYYQLKKQFEIWNI